VGVCDGSDGVAGTAVGGGHAESPRRMRRLTHTC